MPQAGVQTPPVTPPCSCHAHIVRATADSIRITHATTGKGVQTPDNRPASKTCWLSTLTDSVGPAAGNDQAGVQTPATPGAKTGDCGGSMEGSLNRSAGHWPVQTPVNAWWLSILSFNGESIRFHSSMIRRGFRSSNPRNAKPITEVPD